MVVVVCGGGGGGGSVSVHVCVFVCACVLCMEQANNQKKGKMKTTSQQGKKMIGVPMKGFEPTPSFL